MLGVTTQTDEYQQSLSLGLFLRSPKCIPIAVYIESIQEGGEWGIGADGRMMASVDRSGTIWDSGGFCIDL